MRKIEKSIKLNLEGIKWEDISQKHTKRAMLYSDLPHCVQDRAYTAGKAIFWPTSFCQREGIYSRQSYILTYLIVSKRGHTPYTKLYSGLPHSVKKWAYSAHKATFWPTSRCQREGYTAGKAILQPTSWQTGHTHHTKLYSDVPRDVWEDMHITQSYILTYLTVLTRGHK